MTCPQICPSSCTKPQLHAPPGRAPTCVPHAQQKSPPAKAPPEVDDADEDGTPGEAAAGSGAVGEVPGGVPVPAGPVTTLKLVGVAGDSPTTAPARTLYLGASAANGGEGR